MLTVNGKAAPRAVNAKSVSQAGLCAWRQTGSKRRMLSAILFQHEPNRGEGKSSLYAKKRGQPSKTAAKRCEKKKGAGPSGHSRENIM